MPFIAVHTQILTPFLHHGVPDDIRGPHIAVDIIAGIRTCCPFLGIESRQVDLYATFLHLCHLRRYKSILVAGIVIIANFPGRREPRPVLQICGIGLGTMRTKDIVTFTVRFIHHRWVVYADAFLRDSLIE